MPISFENRRAIGFDFMLWNEIVWKKKADFCNAFFSFCGHSHFIKPKRWRIGYIHNALVLRRGLFYRGLRNWPRFLKRESIFAYRGHSKILLLTRKVKEGRSKFRHSTESPFQRRICRNSGQFASFNLNFVPNREMTKAPNILCQVLKNGRVGCSLHHRLRVITGFSNSLSPTNPVFPFPGGLFDARDGFKLTLPRSLLPFRHESVNFLENFLLGDSHKRYRMPEGSQLEKPG